MKTKFILVLSGLLLGSIFQPLVQARTNAGINVHNSVHQSNENKLGGIVSKITDTTIEINTITYEFSQKQAKVYDLDNRVNQMAEIKVGMFVNFSVIDDKNKARITEIRLIKK